MDSVQDQTVAVESEFVDLDAIAALPIPQQDVTLDAFGGKKIKLVQLNARRVSQFFGLAKDQERPSFQALLIAAHIADADGSFKYEDISSGVETVSKLPYDAFAVLFVASEELTPLTENALLKRAKKLAAPSASDS